MNDETRARIIERVRKMLRLARDAGATEGERENAMRMAHATLAKYNLDIATAEAAADAAGRSRPSDADDPRSDLRVEFGGWPWARHVCASIGDLFFCDYLYAAKKNVWKTAHFFIGRKSNATTAALLSEFVVTSIIREALRIAGQRHEGNAWVRSFCWGAANRVRSRVAELKRDQEQFAPAAAPADAAGKALVLASYYDSEKAANRAMVAAILGDKPKKGRDGKYADRADGYHAGRAYGDSVSLNVQVK